MLAAIDAVNGDRVTAINISMQNAPNLPDGVDRHGSNLSNVIRARDAEGKFLEEILHGMETMGQPYLDHVLVTIAAGNYGLDLTEQLNDLKERYPNAWDHVVIAGGLDSNNERIRDFNTSENPDDVIYAQMPQGLYGTSFAAPQLTCLATALAAARPDLNSWQLKKAILESAPVISTYRTKPTLAAALAKANELFPPNAPTPDIVGTWSGPYTATVTESNGLTYNDGGTLTWTITSVSDNYFSGTISLDGVELLWVPSGEFYGYTSCSGSVSGAIYGNILDGNYYYYVTETGTTARWHFTATLSEGTLTNGRSYSKGSLSFTLTHQ
jgi:hypothetical protein